MHPDLERQIFLDHLTSLRQENERLRMAAGRNQEWVCPHCEEYRDRMERLEAQNAVLTARLNRPRPLTPPRPPQGAGHRHAGNGLGHLAHAQVVELHARQVDVMAIAAMAGVDRSSVSRWRKANGYIMAWVPRACGSPAQDGVQGNVVVADGRDDGQVALRVPVGQQAS